MKLLALLMGLAFASSANAGATLVGDTVDAGMYRTIDNGYGIGRVLGYGLDAPFLVQAGPGDRQQYSSAFTLDVDSNSFRIDFMNAPFGWQPGSVFRLQDLHFSNGAALPLLTVDSNLAGYGLSAGVDFIELDLGGVQIADNAYFLGTFATAEAVPEPSSLALMALALASAAGAGRFVRRRTRASLSGR